MPHLTLATAVVLALTTACSHPDSAPPAASSSSGTPDPSAADPAKREAATIAVKKLAFEAYPSWSVSHSDRACPSTIAELFENLALPVADPWGHAYRMYCGADLPQGAHGLAITSDGPDGKPGTADDIRSWD